MTEILSDTISTPTLDLYLLSLLPMLEETQSETGWSHDVRIDYIYDPLNRLKQAKYNNGQQFDYTYDATGNRLTQTADPGPGDPVVINYQYDIANRLVYVNGQPYTWDANGNLLGDSAGTYTYDRANRLVSSSEGGLVASYAYNGMGDRLQQTVNSVTATYSLDIASGLTQVLADGTKNFLYGNGRIAQYTGTTPEYFLGDALGSVRQLVDGSGNVVLAKEYEPYGEVMNSAGTSSSSYGFTGEWTDYTGLVYLRARYYDPTNGRFMTKDTWGGDMTQPMSYNAWLYVLANPIKFTDPFGLLPIKSSISIQNDRDLTSWLYRELTTNVDSYYIKRINTLLGGSIKDKYNASNAWMWLVKDSAKWDFKHKIEFEMMGRAITFLDYKLGYRWYEYSVPGNIFYGYIGSAAGFSEFILHGGASYAEITDPSHREQGESCCPSVCAGIYYGFGPLNIGISLYCKQLGCYYVKPIWARTFFDDPTDYNAIRLGINLYKTYKNNLTYSQFVDSIYLHGDSLSHPTFVPPTFEWINPFGGWPYAVGRFNGPNDAVNEPVVLRYLK